MPKLDSKDYSLLRLLDDNGRASLSSLGRALRLSKTAVANRISVLEAEKILLGYYTVIDSSRLGFLSFRVYLKFSRTNPKLEERILVQLESDKRVWWIGLVQGTWNLGFVIWVKNIYEFRNFWLAFMLKFRRYVGRYQISAYGKLRHYPLSYLEGSKKLAGRKSIVVGEGPHIEIDEKDRELLGVISSDARLPVVQMAKKSGLTPAIVKYRLKKLLQNKVIQGFKASINTPALGYSLYKVDFAVDDLTKMSEIKSFVESVPNLVYIDETVGGGDLEANFHFKSNQELEQMLNTIKQKFYASIREYDYFVYSKVVKYSYFPLS